MNIETHFSIIAKSYYFIKQIWLSHKNEKCTVCDFCRKFYGLRAEKNKKVSFRYNCYKFCSFSMTLVVFFWDFQVFFGVFAVCRLIFLIHFIRGAPGPAFSMRFVGKDINYSSAKYVHNFAQKRRLCKKLLLVKYFFFRCCRIFLWHFI